jgi:hypothetical protein
MGGAISLKENSANILFQGTMEMELILLNKSSSGLFLLG